MVDILATLLLVDDEPELLDALSEYLGAQRFRVLEAADASAARRLLDRERVDLAVLDVNMPGEDGISLARFIRERFPKTGIVMLTSASSVVDRVVGLEVGADDYVPKPCDPRELLARVRSVLRRTGSVAEKPVAGRVVVGRCELDIAAQRLFDVEGAEVNMTPLEFDLLSALVGSAGHVVRRERLLELGRQRDWDPSDRSVDIRVLRLRRKIEPDPERPRFIRTVRGTGYLFVPDGVMRG